MKDYTISDEVLMSRDKLEDYLKREQIKSLQNHVNHLEHTLRVKGLKATFADVDYWRQGQRALAVLVAEQIRSKDNERPD